MDVLAIIDEQDRSDSAEIVPGSGIDCVGDLSILSRPHL